MKKNIALYLIIPWIILSNVNAQDTYGGLVGFSCSITGAPSVTVRKMSKLVLESKYEVIKELLINGNSAERYLSVILCETLQSRHIVYISQNENEVIQRLYNSDVRIQVCSGCTLFKTFSFSELLQGIVGKDFRNQTRKWAQRIVKKKVFKNNSTNGKQ